MTDDERPSAAFDQWFDALPENDDVAPYILAWRAYQQAQAELKVELLNARAEAQYWRDRCAVYEAHHAKLETSAADIRGRVEQFLIVLQAARPQGTDKRAKE